MADGIAALVPASVPGGVRAVINGVITTKENLGNAAAAIGLERARKFDARLALFVAATKKTVAPADAVKARLDLELLRKTLDDQEGAIKFWQELIDERLTALSATSAPEVISVLNERITELKGRQEKEQGDVNQFKLRIAELTAWLAYVEKGQQAQTYESAAARKTGSRSSASGGPAKARKKSTA